MSEWLRAIPPSFSGDVVRAIDDRLRLLSDDERVTIPLAIESGSRAWGFPSPDSDYDCRFIYVRSMDGYLSPWQKRDVLETPLDHVFDVNGWDLGKAIKLLLKGNAVVIEWLTSPIIYGADPFFRDAMTRFGQQYARRELVARHYLHLGLQQRRAYFGDGAAVPMKKLFYVVRPAAALRWLRVHPEAAIAPMHFPRLIAEADVSAELHSIIDDLIAAKAVTRELGVAPVPDAIYKFIDEEYALAQKLFDGSGSRTSPEVIDAAEQLFQQLVRHYDREAGHA